MSRVRRVRLAGDSLCFQEIFGVNEHIRDVTSRFAREGYLAAAPELFHRTGPGFESGYTDMTPGRTHAQATTDEGLAAAIRATFDWLENSGGGKAGSGAVELCKGGPLAAPYGQTL